MGSEAVKMKKFFKGDSRRPMEVNLKIKVELRGTLPYKPQRILKKPKGETDFHLYFSYFPGRGERPIFDDFAQRR